MEVNILDEESSKDREQYKNSTYLIVSKIAYLIGAPEEILTSDRVPPKLNETYLELEQNKNARIIRNLCIIRCGISLSICYFLSSRIIITVRTTRPTTSAISLAP